MENEILNLESKARSELNKIIESSELDQLEIWRISYLGRKGEISKLMSDLVKLSADDKRIMGPLANKCKTSLEKIYSNALEVMSLKSSGSNAENTYDVTLPGRLNLIGRKHITTLMIEKIVKIFISMGFSVAEGPEIESDKYNFEMLNIPKYHPARDMWDTLWVTTDQDSNNIPMLLRTHTSPVQVRIMESENPPIRIISPGKCYRYEATDSTHEWHFFQIEGLVVGKDISFANLKATLNEFIYRIFGNERKVRFRCDYFPFVEPGVDVSIDCFRCNGKDIENCSTCNKTGWIEVMGAGMVHPRVLEGVGYDITKYSGFAFGMGVERIAMLKYDVDDIRLFYSNDIRFLSQFHGML